MTSEPRKRPKHKKLPDFAVRFVGYSARVVARKKECRLRNIRFRQRGDMFDGGRRVGVCAKPVRLGLRYKRFTVLH